MIEIMKQPRENILGARLSGIATQEDYEKVFIPALNERIGRFGKIHVLFFMDESFDGWELGAMWDDVKYGLQHRKDFDKIAVVGGPKWSEWAVKLSAHLLEGEVKTFPVEDLDRAWSWVESP